MTPTQVRSVIEACAKVCEDHASVSSSQHTAHALWGTALAIRALDPATLAASPADEERRGDTSNPSRPNGGLIAMNIDEIVKRYPHVKISDVDTLVSYARDQLAAKPDISALVDRFLRWPLPQSVSSDGCVTDRRYPHPRSGTNLLTADETRQMLEYVLNGVYKKEVDR